MTSRNVTALDEDVYTEALSSIIERDFFPDLARLKAETAFVDALASRDPLRIDIAKRALDALEYDRDDTRSVASTARTGVVNTSLRLGAFQQRYTSEDNASFNDLLDEANRKLRAKLAWMFERNKAGARGGGEEEMRMIEGAPGSGAAGELMAPAAASGELVLASGSAAAVVDPDDRDAKLRLLLPSTDHRGSAVVPTWEHRTLNAFMFPPSSATTAKLRAQKPAVTNYAATRFADSTPLAQFTQAVLDSAAPTPAPLAPSPSDTPYSLVSMTPRPHGAAADMVPDMTWGAIEATPVALRDESGTAAASEPEPHRYRIPDTPVRELLGIRKVEQLRHSRTTHSSRSARTPATPRTPWDATPGSSSAASVTSAASRRSSAIAVGPKSEAARGLLHRAGGVDAMLRASYACGGGGVKKRAVPEGWSMRSARSGVSIATPFSFTPTVAVAKKKK
ncbi:hypothetical protein H9P43_009710 [Blastocladiella emersonii ATCC 22665]|nr:hypothetical protein H9P43_009710 [Blastocladiella emersonii ATCC 22665]